MTHTVEASRLNRLYPLACLQLQFLKIYLAAGRIIAHDTGAELHANKSKRTIQLQFINIINLSGLIFYSGRLI